MHVLHLLVLNCNLVLITAGVFGFLRDVMRNKANDPTLMRCFPEHGCFTIGGKFASDQRPLNFFPVAPEQLFVQFYLYTRRNPQIPIYLNQTEESIRRSTFRSDIPLKVIIHGFLDDAEVKWILRMTKELLNIEDMNVIVVDWRNGALLPYTQATANTRILGVIIAKFLTFLKETFSVPLESVHLIGHSLGAHAAGYAGQNLKRLGRITSMDAAQPYFDFTHPMIRIDPSDALFVDAIHTDTTPIIKLGFGVAQTVGHVDFYPNGGDVQPGCDKSIVEKLVDEKFHFREGFRQIIACNHNRAISYFIESINSQCPFMAIECSSMDEFNKGHCFDCGKRGEKCALMGYHADKWFHAFGKSVKKPMKMYLLLGTHNPFCRFQHRIAISMTNDITKEEVIGRLTVRLFANDGWSTQLPPNQKEALFSPATTYMFLLTTILPKPITRLNLEWKPQIPRQRSPMLSMFLGHRPPPVTELSIDTVEIEGLEISYRCTFQVDTTLTFHSSSVSLTANDCSRTAEEFNLVNTSVSQSVQALKQVTQVEAAANADGLQRLSPNSQQPYYYHHQQEQPYYHHHHQQQRTEIRHPQPAVYRSFTEWLLDKFLH